MVGAAGSLAPSTLNGSASFPNRLSHALPHLPSHGATLELMFHRSSRTQRPMADALKRPAVNVRIERSMPRSKPTVAIESAPDIAGLPPRLKVGFVSLGCP